MGEHNMSHCLEVSKGFCFVFHLEELPDLGRVRILLGRNLTEHGVNDLEWPLAFYQLAWEGAECLSSIPDCFRAIYIHLNHLLFLWWVSVFYLWSLWRVKTLVLPSNYFDASIDIKSGWVNGKIHRTEEFLRSLFSNFLTSQMLSQLYMFILMWQASRHLLG